MNIVLCGKEDVLLNTIVTRRIHPRRNGIWPFNQSWPMHNMTKFVLNYNNMLQFIVMVHEISSA